MNNSASSNKRMAAAVIFCVVFLLAAALAVYFYLDASQAALAIEEIENKEYAGVTLKKAGQSGAFGEPLSAQVTESLEYSEYKTPLGFTIVSYSSNWTDSKLVNIYDELLNNGHGDEMGYLSQVILYPDKDPDYGEEVDFVGERADATIDPYVFVDIPTLIPPGLSYNTNIIASDISIYYMDQYDDASQVADTLAHEYGHHFTMFYFMQSNDAVKQSDYYTLRNFSGFPEAYEHEVFYEDWDEYYENHMWDIYEIAAEDYVQLLGSPTTKQTMDFMDRYDLLKKDMDSYDPDIKDELINVFPQENIFIPLADETPGLRDYYNSFIGLENEYDAPLETADFNIQFKKHSSHGKRYYDITWTMVNTDPQTLYTLVCYDTDGNLYWPVRTVYGDEDPIARVGTPVVGSYYWPDGIPREDRIFKLYVLLPDGRMIASEPVYKNF